MGPGGPREARAGFAGDRSPGPRAASPRPARERRRGPAPGDRAETEGSEKFPFLVWELALVRLFVLGGWFFFSTQYPPSATPGTLSGPQLFPPPGAFCALANHFSLFPRFCLG